MAEESASFVKSSETTEQDTSELNHQLHRPTPLLDYKFWSNRKFGLKPCKSNQKSFQNDEEKLPLFVQPSSEPSERPMRLSRWFKKN